MALYLQPRSKTSQVANKRAKANKRLKEITDSPLMSFY